MSSDGKNYKHKYFILGFHFYLLLNSPDQKVYQQGKLSVVTFKAIHLQNIKTLNSSVRKHFP